MGGQTESKIGTFSCPRKAYGTFCTELLDAAGDDSAVLEEPAMVGSRSGAAGVCVVGCLSIACRSDEGGSMHQSFWTISRFSQAEIQDAAASLIAAAWRMTAQRRRQSERVGIFSAVLWPDLPTPRNLPPKIHKKIRQMVRVLRDLR